MIGEKVEKLGRAIGSGEERLKGFGSKERNRIAVLAITAAAFLCFGIFFYLNLMWTNAACFVLEMLIAFVIFAAAGTLFADVFKNSFRKYIFADIILAVLLIPLLDLISIFFALDLSNITGGILLFFGRGLLWNLLVFGVPAAASIVFGRFVIHKKKRVSQMSEANN
ncbi:MAG: hypothetical protein K2J77_12820 [Oscillospiraceae bacterium]|nr:hypothetical protein [Oscillospiraceae bacterium]